MVENVLSAEGSGVILLVFMFGVTASRDLVSSMLE